MKLSNFTLALYLCSSAAMAQLLPSGEVVLSGDIAQGRDLSAAQRVGDFLAIASDEGIVLQLFRKKDDSHYHLSQSIQLLPTGSSEIDMEALAQEGETLYVLGSHSKGRRTVSQHNSQSENRERFAEIVHEPSRDNLFLFDIDPATGSNSTNIRSVSLRKLVTAHAILGLFANIPGKENGIDFEGLAVADGRLYLGLRGPVMRENYVPVLSLGFNDVPVCEDNFEAHPDKCSLLYVNLAGLGVRSLHSVDGGFLILAGPTNDRRGSYDLYFWDGLDCMPDEGITNCRLQNLGAFPIFDGGGPEGLAVLEESPSSWRILLVYDGVMGGAPTLFEVARP
jgi:hypothetical protein